MVKTCPDYPVKGEWVTVGSSGTGPSGPEVLQKRECTTDSGGSGNICMEYRFHVPTDTKSDIPEPSDVPVEPTCMPWTSAGGGMYSRYCITDAGSGCMQTATLDPDGSYIILYDGCNSIFQLK